MAAKHLSLQQPGSEMTMLLCCGAKPAGLCYGQACQLRCLLLGTGLVPETCLGSSNKLWFLAVRRRALQQEAVDDASDSEEELAAFCPKVTKAKGRAQLSRTSSCGRSVPCRALCPACCSRAVVTDQMRVFSFYRGLCSHSSMSRAACTTYSLLGKCEMSFSCQPPTRPRFNGSHWIMCLLSSSAVFDFSVS